MVRLIRRLVTIGVSEDLGELAARRIRITNLATLVAILVTILTSILYTTWINPAAAWQGWAINLTFVAGYALAITANARGRVDLAVWIALTIGTAQIFVLTFFVGFDEGPAPFLLVIAVGAVILTRIEDRLTRWFFISVSVVVYIGLAVIDPPRPETARAMGSLSPIRQFVLMILFAVGVVAYQRLLAHRAEEALQLANQRSEQLLLNIMPGEIADRLRGGETQIADRVDHVTVMFIDLVGSTPMAEMLPAASVVDMLNDVFSKLDALTDLYGLEKIKTIGDAYMVVGGLPKPRLDHAYAIADMALDAIGTFDEYIVPGFGRLEMRIGIDTGSVVAGVIGKRKFGYDLWGKTVNTASRMQTTGLPGEIHVTETVFQTLADSYRFEGPRLVSVKGIGEAIPTYALRGRI